MDSFFSPPAFDFLFASSSDFTVVLRVGSLLDCGSRRRACTRPACEPPHSTSTARYNHKGPHGVFWLNTAHSVLEVILNERTDPFCLPHELQPTPRRLAASPVLASRAVREHNPASTFRGGVEEPVYRQSTCSTPHATPRWRGSSVWPVPRSSALPTLTRDS